MNYFNSSDVIAIAIDSKYNKLSSLFAAIKFYRLAMQIVPDIEFKINYSRPVDADRVGGN